MRVFIDGQLVNLNPPAIILGGRVLVPVRGTFEAMGATVSFVHPRTIFVVRGPRVIELEIGRPIARVDDRQVAMDVPPMDIAGHTRIPLRFVGEALGAEVYFDRPTQTVEIITNAVDAALPGPEASPQSQPAAQPQPVPQEQPVPQAQPVPQPVPVPVPTRRRAGLPPLPIPLPIPAPDSQPPQARPARPTVVFPLPGTSVGNPVAVQGAAPGATRVRVTVSVPMISIPIGSAEATVLPVVGVFSANVSYPSLFRGLPLSISVVAIDGAGVESDPVTVLVRQG